MNCLSHLQDHWPKQGVLRVELFFDTPPDNYDLQQSYAKEFENFYEDFHFNQSQSVRNQLISMSNKYFFFIIIKSNFTCILMVI